jgi:hypothetical protein
MYAIKRFTQLRSCQGRELGDLGYSAEERAYRDDVRPKLRAAAADGPATERSARRTKGRAMVARAPAESGVGSTVMHYGSPEVRDFFLPRTLSSDRACDIARQVAQIPGVAAPLMKQLLRQARPNGLAEQLDLQAKPFDRSSTDPARLRVRERRRHELENRSNEMQS